MKELQQYSESIICLPFSYNLNNKGKRKQWKKTKKLITLETLDYTLVIQTMSSSLSFLFWVSTNWFPSKMMTYKLNHNLMCLGHVPLSKGLETNLKLLTNKKDQFHWTLVSSGPKTSVVSVTYTHIWSCCNSSSNTT
jgi:hypothetical protein